MSSNFDAVWSDIQSKLHAGDRIQSWSADSGYTGGQFEIAQVHRDAVVAVAENTDAPRRIARGEFEKIFAYWSDYCAGKPEAARSKLRNQSHNLTYVFSIFHWQEEQSNRAEDC
ncbi:MAG TPA: hypothetical protein VF532_16225 [Candidatus Angelobacter sp.]